MTIMVNTKALSLAVGTTFALMMALQALVAYVVGVNVQIPNVNYSIETGSAILGFIVGLIVAFLFGAIFGAIGGGIYNKLVKGQTVTRIREEKYSFQV